MTDLLSNPLCLPEHLGQPIPDSLHAVSACLPTWRDAVGYEEKEPRVIDALAAGYPRFVYHPLCRRLFDECDRRFADDESTCLAFGSRHGAERFAEYLAVMGRAKTTLHALGHGDVTVAQFPKVFADVAKSFWQHGGEGISSRHAQACLNDEPIEDGTAAKQTLRRRIAHLANVDPTDVYLFPTGMAAIYTLHRALLRIDPHRRCAQFGFPYVDTLKILQKFGAGAVFFPRGDAAELEQLAAALGSEPLNGIFTELPSNPLLATPDLVRLAALARQHDTPLIIDDTIATWANVDALQYADVTCTSLTKSFSGVGDVAGGCLILERTGRHYADLRPAIESEYEDLLIGPDAIALEHNSRDFAHRVDTMNQNASVLVETLREHPAVARVHHPLVTTRDRYEQARRTDGGYGSLLSIELRDARCAAPRFYDALGVCKGPNLGTNYTLACPYTILAHYHELSWAESCGVSRYLVRISVGLEGEDDLIERFTQALSHC